MSVLQGRGGARSDAASSAVLLHVTRGPSDQCFIVAETLPGSTTERAAREAYSRLAEVLVEESLETVHERVFASPGAVEVVQTARTAALTARGVSAETPVTFVDGRPPWGDGLAGIIIHAVRRGGAVRGVRNLDDDGRPCGRVWRCAETTTVVLQGVTGVPSVGGQAPAGQAAETIERADRLLRACGLSFRDVARTWFYIADIVDWYGEFNRARSAKYREFGLPTANTDAKIPLPASTGIGVRLWNGAALSLDLIAVKNPQPESTRVRALRNPAQPEAVSYGSAFSRGTLIPGPDGALIQVSGTAAIDEQGRSLHPGDLRAQVECTLDKIEALLRPPGARLSDICAATAFVNHPSGAACFREALQARGLTRLPAVCVVGEVCRRELLFELDAEAILR